MSTKQAGSTGPSGFMGSVARFWQRSYVPDYVGLALLLIAYLVIQLLLEPFHRVFSLDNTALQYPHAAIERVSVPYNILYSFVLPLLLILLYTLLTRPPLHKTHITILGLLTTLLLTSFLADIIKNTVGRPRPDLIARCKPRKGTPAHGLVTIEVCTEKAHHVLHDGWRSFPSGHSSFAFAGLGYLALLLAGQLHIFRPQTDLARVLVALAPLLGAALIAISRLEDYRHDVYDVSAGSILGLSIAYFTYRRYYPALGSKCCDVPYPIRAEVVKMDGFARVGDEERGESEGGFEDGDGVEGVRLRETSRERRREGGGAVG